MKQFIIYNQNLKYKYMKSFFNSVFLINQRPREVPTHHPDLFFPFFPPNHYIFSSQWKLLPFNHTCFYFPLLSSHLCPHQIRLTGITTARALVCEWHRSLSSMCSPFPRYEIFTIIFRGCLILSNFLNYRLIFELTGHLYFSHY